MADIVRFSRDPEVFAKANRLYEAISTILTEMLPYAAVHHVGSTAVPGSLTKGDLDVVVHVAREDFADAEALLASRFARNTGSYRAEDFAAFIDSNTEPELGIQLVAIGGSAHDFVAFRDLLRVDFEVRSQYDRLKSSYEGMPMEAYREAKAGFIETVLTQRGDDAADSKR